MVHNPDIYVCVFSSSLGLTYLIILQKSVPTVPAHIFFSLWNDFLLSSPMPTSYLIDVKAKTFINEK